MPRTYTFNHVAGLQRAIRTLPKEAKARLRRGSLAIAKDVAPKAADRARRVGGVAAYVAPTIKARSDTVPKIVQGGTAMLPSRDGRPRQGDSQTVGAVMWGAEFGSDRFRQFSPWRGSGTGAGYFLFPEVRAQSDAIMERWDEAFMDAVDSAARRNDG